MFGSKKFWKIIHVMRLEDSRPVEDGYRVEFWSANGNERLDTWLLNRAELEALEEVIHEKLQ